MSDDEFNFYAGTANAGSYELRLFVAGSSPVSVRAIINLRAVLEKYLAGNYELTIIDIYQQPALAQQENITALPMLLKKGPPPKRLLVGDMSDTSKVLRGLGLSNGNET